MNDSGDSSVGSIPRWSEVFHDYISPGLPVDLVISTNPQVTMFIDSSASRLGARLNYPKGEAVPSSPLRSVTISKVSQSGLVFLEVATSVKELYQTFYFLLSDIILQVVQHGVPALTALEDTLKKWQDLLRQAEILSSEQQTGLFGELWLLRRLISAFGPELIHSWVGPKREAHDFRLDAIEIEVKTTLRSRRLHKINGLSQLLPSPGFSLHIVSLRLLDGGLGGTTLPNLINEIRADLSLCTPSLDRFNDCLVASRYHDVDASHYPTRRRLADNAILVEVVDGVPRLTPEALQTLDQRFATSRIQEVSYLIDLTDLGFQDGSAEFLATLPASSHGTKE